MFLESESPEISKQRELDERQGPCSWSLENQESKNQVESAEGQAHVLRRQGIQKEIELAERQSPWSWSLGIQESQNKRNWLRGRAHVLEYGIQGIQKQSELAERRSENSRIQKTEGIG